MSVLISVSTDPISFYRLTNNSVIFNFFPFTIAILSSEEKPRLICATAFAKETSDDHHHRSRKYLGLFGSSSDRIESLGVTNANVTGEEFSSILSGTSTTIVACYTTGKV